MRLLILILCMGILAANDEFIISYRAIVKNQILIGEEYNVSRALSISKDYNVVGVCNFIPNLMPSEDFSIESNQNVVFNILKQHKDIMLSCLQKHTNTKIRDDVVFINNALKSKITFEVMPQRILAIYDGNTMNIEIIERIK